MTPADKLWINKNIISLKKANSLNFHQGLNYGACVYEGIRFYSTKNGSCIFRLKEHLDRFFYSASVLRMNLAIDYKEITEAIINLIKANKLSSGYIRPMAYYSEPKMGINIINAEVTIVILMWPWIEGSLGKEVSMKIVTLRRLDPRTVDLKAKISGYYANGLLGFIEAREAGFDEPLFLDVKDFIAEGAVNNIFIVKNKEIFTPKMGNILGGITRDTVIQIACDIGLKVYEQNIRPDFLRNADEIFLTGTGIELEKVVKIDDIFTQINSTSIILNNLQQKYRAIIAGNDVKYQGWLTPVPIN